ncbi:MAG: PKD domain-containing protein, partial [Bacteroidetes bacterium]
DKTPPSANFSFTQDEADFKKISFTNLSISATDFAWDFGDGSSSNEKNPTHVYPGEGTYTVSLTASDKLGAQNTYSTAVKVEEKVVPFVPVILNPGFDEKGNDNYRDHWRNGDLGGVIQITSSPVHEGVKAAKLPSGGDRIAYQLIKVLKNTDYIVSFYYTMKSSPVGTLSVAILGGAVNDPALVEPATIASVNLNDQSDPSTYVLASVAFNSGEHDEVAIFVSNVGVECRIDTFTIVED